MTKKEELDWSSYLKSEIFEIYQEFSLETLYQAFKERMEKEREEGARPSLERESFGDAVVRIERKHRKPSGYLSEELIKGIKENEK